MDLVIKIQHDENGVYYAPLTVPQAIKWPNGDDLQDKLDTLVNGGKYNSTTKNIELKHDNTVIANIDATDFLVDGMVDDVRIENGNLVIDFNTASGKQDIPIPLTDIFNPNNYYTKTEVDSALTTKADLTNGLVPDSELPKANATGTVAGIVKLRTNNQGVNNSGLSIGDNGTISATITGAATDADIETGTSTEKALTPSNMGKIEEIMTNSLISDPTAGHEYVEIGGIKWATMNIGASSETDYGLYFQWGDTQGYTKDEVGSGEGQKYFGWEDYKYGNGTSSPGAAGMTKYNETDGLRLLELSDDAAKLSWGSQWRMPTLSEFNTLLNSTTNEWVTDYQGSGVSGRLFTDTTDSSKKLFFPASGKNEDGMNRQPNAYGYYWANQCYNGEVIQSHYLIFTQGDYCRTHSTLRYRGFTVRGVLDTSVPPLHKVSMTGDYNDLINKPDFVNNGSYNSTTKEIELKHDNTILATIDATAFIKDGMVDSVTIQNDNLVITFNTDAGKQPISIPLTQIFNPSNYYTKSDIDTQLATKADIVNGTVPTNELPMEEIKSEVVDSIMPEPEYVDLGLPSGTLWAKANVGATSEEEYGDYFSWGNIIGHTSSNGSTFDDGYDWGSSTNGAPYNTTPGYSLTGNIGTGDATHDAAQANLGYDWRLPTKEEFKELYDNTDSVWTTINGVNGRKFMKKGDNATYVFFPASGLGNGTSLSNRGSYGCYWSSSYNDSNDAYSMFFYSSSVFPQYSIYRSYGFSVRGVLDAYETPSKLHKVALTGNYNDLENKPTIPAEVTETTVSNWGFTKNTGTYSKPTGGIPKTDLATDVQTSLGKADTALQSYTETDPTVPSWAKATNKPTYNYSEISNTPTLATVATSGSYNDLINKPTILTVASASDVEEGTSTEKALTPSNMEKIKSEVEDSLLPKDPAAGHDYVEIGGLKWATMNVGANSVTDYGLYFQWGDTQGYTADQVGSGEGQKAFKWSDYKWTEDGGSTFTKYNATDGKTVLDIEDDAARANMGGQWRMPTTAEFQALGNAVNAVWTTDYNGSGVAGLVCTDKTDSSKTLFFPAAGCAGLGSMFGVGDVGYVWSSSLGSSYVDYAWSLNFGNEDTYWDYNFRRYYGFSVRGVLDAGETPSKLHKVAVTGDYNDLENKPTPTTAEEVAAGTATNKALTPANLNDILAVLLGKNFGDSTHTIGELFQYVLNQIEPVREFVDLGLPSGKLWAAEDVTGDDAKYIENGYYYYAALDDNDTPVAANAVAQWSHNDSTVSLPTKDDMQELIDNTDYTTVTINGVNYAKFTSKVDATKYITIPMAGYDWRGEVMEFGEKAYTWTSTPQSVQERRYYNLEANTTNAEVSYSVVPSGHILRAIRTPEPMPVEGDVQIFADPECTQYATGEVDTVYVRINVPWNGLDSGWAVGNSMKPGTCFVANSPTPEDPNDPYAIFVYVDYMSTVEGPYEAGQVVEAKIDSALDITNFQKVFSRPS